MKPLRGATAEPMALYEELYAIIEDNVRRVAKGKAYRQVTDEYLTVAEEDGSGSARSIDFLFHDSGGTCSASVHACNHWFELYVSALAQTRGKTPSPLDEIAARHGLAIAKKPVALGVLLKTCVEPLVELRGHVFGVAVRRSKAAYLVSDAIDDAIELEDLTAKERAKVDSAVKKKHCACVVCESLRTSPEVRLPKAKKVAPPKAAKAPESSVRTTLTGNDRRVFDNRCTELPDDVFEPTTIERFDVDAPITKMPEALGRLTSLRSLSLKSTKIEHLPEMLTRMPHVVRLLVSESPLQLAELSKMPWLEELVLFHIPSIASLQLDALPRLHKLELYNVEQVPTSLSEARELRSLKIEAPAVRSLPSLERLNKLEALELEVDSVEEIPSLASLGALRRLTIASSSLRALPDIPRALEWLKVNGPNVDALPFAELSSLEMLVVFSELAELPRAMGRLPALRDLTIDSPALARVHGDALPRSLETLNIRSSAHLRELPDAIGELGALGVLTLSKLPALASLPKAMGKLKRLRFLNLTETPGVFPLPDFLAKLPIEYFSFARAGASKQERARWKAVFPKARIE